MIKPATKTFLAIAIKQAKQKADVLIAKNNILVTTTHNVEGYKITEYITVVCGEVVVPNGLMGAFTTGTFFTIEALDMARSKAIDQLKDKAYLAEADGVVALDIDITDLNGKGVMVSANGTAVKLEKI